jgi:phage gpG-like protein
MVFGIDGTKLPYAKFHVVGTKYMPQRVYIGFTRKQRTAIKIIIAQWIKETMRGNDPVKSRGSRK